MQFLCSILIQLINKLKKSLTISHSHCLFNLYSPPTSNPIHKIHLQSTQFPHSTSWSSSTNNSSSSTNHSPPPSRSAGCYSHLFFTVIIIWFVWWMRYSALTNTALALEERKEKSRFNKTLLDTWQSNNCTHCPSLKYSFSVVLNFFEYLTNSFLRCSTACLPVDPGMNPTTSLTASNSFLMALAISLQLKINRISRKFNWISIAVNKRNRILSLVKLSVKL